MGEATEVISLRDVKREEEEAEAEVWNYVFGYTKMAVVKCAIELGIAEVLEEHESTPMTLSELSSTLRCDPTRLYRIMRFLVHYNIFKETPTSQGTKGYSQTPLSRRLIRHGGNSMAAFILLESSSVMLRPWHNLSARVLVSTGSTPSPFEAAYNEDIWRYAAEHPGHNELINDAMACAARVAVPAVVKGCPEIFDGIGSVVDVGGGTGTALGILVKAFHWLKGINFDLPHVASVATKSDRVENVGGDMFVSIPKADAAFLMWVLHDWDDEDCIKILKRCREAIPEDKGKVIIVEAVLEQKKEEKLKYVGLLLDMVMMAHTGNGKERTQKEWDYVLTEAGFTRYNIKPIDAVQSVIVAYP